MKIHPSLAVRMWQHDAQTQELSCVAGLLGALTQETVL